MRSFSKHSLEAISLGKRELWRILVSGKMSEEEVDRVEKRYNETEKSRLFSLGFMKKENRGF